MPLTTASVTQKTLKALQKLASISGVSQTRILEALVLPELEAVLAGKPPVYARRLPPATMV